MPDYDIDPSAEPQTDGRSLRAQRTAQAIAQAYLDLLGQGDLRPAVRDIAARAGVSERAVFRHFEDTESLFNAVAKMHLASLMQGVPELASATASRRQRVDSFIGRWCWVFERVTPIRRAANLNEPFSAEIQKRHRWARKLRADDFDALFAGELASMSDEDRSDLVDALNSVIDWHTWEHLRVHRKLSVARATAIMTRTLQSLLGAKF